MRQWLTAIKAFWVRDAIIATSYRTNFVFQVFSLFTSSVMFYFISKLIGEQSAVSKYGGYLPFSIIGMAMLTLFNAGYDSFSAAVRNEQSMGTLEYLLLTPIKLSKVIVASSAWNFCWSTVNASVLIILSSLLFGFKLKGDIFLTILVLLLTTAFFSGIGIISASFAMVLKRGDPLKFVMLVSTSMLGGVAFPISLFPNWLQMIANLLPVTHGLYALREILLAGKSFRDVWPQILILSISVAICLPLSLMCFKKSVDIAKCEGNLLHY